MTTPTTPDFRPTHVVPRDGLPAWEEPDVSRPTEPLDPLLPVQLIGRRGDWGQVLCANGWSAWVDGRLLVSVPQEPPAAGQPAARTADPRPLLARVEESLSQYRRAAEDLTAGRTDGEGFHRRTRGLRVGMVVDGESVWLYDAEHERWVYCDGTHLITYAASSSPAHSDPPPHEPTQVAAQPHADPPRPPAAAPEPTPMAGTHGDTPPPHSGPAPPEPTQVVTPPTPDPAGPSADGRDAAPREPTQVVDSPPARPGGPSADDGTAPPAPTHVVTPSDNGRSAPAAPTRTVDPPAAGPSDPSGHGRAAPPEPTRVVDPTAGPTGSPDPSGDGRGAPREPTRVAGAGPVRPAGRRSDDVGRDGGGDGARDREATRLAGPAEHGPSERPAHRPPTRPGDA